MKKLEAVAVGVEYRLKISVLAAPLFQMGGVEHPLKGKQLDRGMVALQKFVNDRRCRGMSLIHHSHIGYLLRGIVRVRHRIQMFGAHGSRYDFSFSLLMMPNMIHDPVRSADHLGVCEQ
ncbi:hypothetical protein D3C71_1541900 [compost metagenome]